mmetsp:Transcript_11570/g.24993  ORF Transcript_11570/g.24993 Transcript_11570/m.24993 type:complete len:522 (-) Transcript_11570:2138-3703(-)
MGGLADAMKRPDELVAMVRFKAKASRAAAVSSARRPKRDPMTAQWEFCYDYLRLVSRSFALVIMELDDELRDPVCIFYLVLRGLDTVEDDTSVPASKRVALCERFHEILEGDSQTETESAPCPTTATTTTWRSSEFGTGPSKELLEQFDRVLACYRALRPEYRAVIREITRRMGAGMAAHIHDKECVSVRDYDQYCFYVAGLVGLGLSDMFVVSGREDAFLQQNEHLSVSMGLFLQKTNIIRDYLEDIHDARTFWPQEIWAKYAPNDALADFANPKHRAAAVECLNAMVADALRHVPDCIEYMSHVSNPFVFNFVAIPQVMALGTLAECFNNPRVFEGVVKLRRGLTAKLAMRTKTMPALFKLYLDFARAMRKKCQVSDPSYELTLARLAVVEELAVPYVPAMPHLGALNVLVAVAVLVLSVFMVQRRRTLDLEGLAHGGVPDPQDMLAAGALFVCVAYMLTFFGLQFMRPTIERSGSSRALLELSQHQHQPRDADAVVFSTTTTTAAAATEDVLLRPVVG